MKISILHPSYGRPELAFKTAINWVSRCVHPLEYIICVSKTDPQLSEYFRLFIPPFRLHFHEKGNMVEQMNRAAELSTRDLLIATSDDFDCPQNWDQTLLKHLEGKKDFIVKTHDGVHGDGIDTKKIVALPIMDRTYYERFGFIYHPDYNHFYGDEELYVVGTQLGKLVTLPVTFEHIHYTAGKAQKDATNIKNSAHFATDKATFIKRQAANFPIL